MDKNYGKFFKKEEFDCRCGCGLNNMQQFLLNTLNTARDYAGMPFFLNRGCSCVAHNKLVGGLPNSAHLDGFAVDIHTSNSEQRFKIVFGLLKAGFKRIGIYKDFVHADVDMSKPMNIIFYNEG